MQGVFFMDAPSTTASSHRMLASTGKRSGNCSVQENTAVYYQILIASWNSLIKRQEENGS